MTYALITITLLLKLNADLLEQNEELNKVLAGARVANEILADALEDEEQVEEQWPNLIG